MKNKKSIMITGKLYLFVALFTHILAIFATAQPENFRVGETVETNDGRVCKILSITGRSAKVACGTNRSDVRVYSFESMKSQSAAEAKRAEDERQRQNTDNTPRPTTISFNQGDAVQTPDGRQGIVESFKMPDMAKVKFDDGTTKFYIRTDLKKIEPPKSVSNEPKETFRVGDVVVIGNGQQVRIDSINGDSAVVRSGPGKYNVATKKLAELVSLKTWERKQSDEKEGKLIRAAFEDDAKSFIKTIDLLAPFYYPKIKRNGGTGISDTPATYAKWRKDLEGLAAVCQKYPNLTNQPFADEATYADSITYRQADWCEMARERETVVRKGMLFLAEYEVQARVGSWSAKIGQRLRNWGDGSISDNLQMLLFDRAAWERKELVKATKKYAELGEKIPASAFAPLEEKINEMKEKIEEDVKTRVWEQPNFKDAALEALARNEFPTDLPGVKVLKTGMTFTTWKAMDDTSFIGSQGDVRFYRITPGAYRYKLGIALVQMPNRPYCQIREFQATQHKAGAGYGAAKASIGGAGIFVKCP